MSIFVPAYLGVVLRKNEKTQPFVTREIEFLKKYSEGKDPKLNEDEFLVGFSVAMNGRDLQMTIENLKLDGAIEGVDFVATSSLDGVIGTTPKWLIAQQMQVEGGQTFKGLSYVET